MRSSTVETSAFAHLRVLVTPQREPGLEDEEVLEDQPPLRRRHERVQRLDVRVVRRESAPRTAPPRAPGQPSRVEDVVGHRIEQLVRQLLERLPDEAPLHVRRDAAGALVDRDDAAGVKLRVVACSPAPAIPDPGP